MADLRELYQEVILDHSRSPRNFREMAGATHTAKGNNPLCGDEVSVFLRVEGEAIVDATFQGRGCAISKSSASMMTDAVRGRRVEDVRRLFDAFHGMVTGAGGVDAGRLGKLAAFGGVAEFPVRVKCASLGWHTMMAALDRKGETVSLE